ncbi:hypothetical protein AB1Y20_014045 [Prymnesium parvum]|uniref:Uncharacterized protein n=1 Tax=Prymnesium parvum TaxID=97485 RepID=A0AB34IFB5_PRYPA
MAKSAAAPQPPRVAIASASASASASAALAMPPLDPWTIGTEPADHAKFFSLGFFQQIDAAVHHASLPDLKNLPPFVLGAAWCAANVFACVALTRQLSGAAAWSAEFHEALLKNALAYDSLACHSGVAMMYCLLGTREFRLKYTRGTIKEPYFAAWMSRRRGAVDVLMHAAFVLSRLWLLASADPSPACAAAYFGTIAWMYFFDYGEYVGAYGMYHGPWSLFILAKYSSSSGAHRASATALMQFLLQLLYVGCGLGKMGPWFTCVFNQEWTLPPWAKLLDLRRLLYRNDFPRDNTPSTAATVLSYAAGATEWIAPLLLLLSPAVIGGDRGALTWPVAVGLSSIIAMHVYIVLHMPMLDVWLLNVVPAYVTYNTYYQSPLLPEPGFYHAGFWQLHPVLLAFCLFMVFYCLYGQLHPEKMTYMHCYRFWAGNWPQAYVLISKSGLQKLEAGFPHQVKAGLPGAVFKKLQGELWVFNYMGIFQNAQLPHRALPVALHAATTLGAKLRGEAPPESLADFQRVLGGLFCPGIFMATWVSGWIVNDALRCPYVMNEMQKVCEFEPGEFILVIGHSFPLLAGVTGAKSKFVIYDAKQGVLAEGSLTPHEAVAITRPSLLSDYETTKHFNFSVRKAD